ncbi:MAG: hypothetical protein JW940_05595 [Polyangiaceae bacterium]|nr:hypothetical protein [Polyangiaceae bacterium]
MSLVLTLVAWTTTVACVTASFVQFRRTTRRALGSPGEALLALARGDRFGRRSLRADDRARELVEAVLAAPHGRVRVATLNERLLDIERMTDDVAVVPRAGARIALFTGLGCAVLAVAQVPSDAASVVVTLTSMCAGVGGAVSCACFGRLASRLARLSRNDYNKLAERLTNELHVR